MEIEYRDFEYNDEDGNIFEGLLAQPKNAENAPGVLIFPAFKGCSQLEKERAKDLAKLGFVALAADCYGKGKTGSTFEDYLEMLMPMFNDRQGLLKKRIFAAFEAIKSMECVDPNKIAAIGFCFGGMCAVDLARHHVDIKAAVSFHGTLTPLPGAPLDKINATIQIHHGDPDVHICREDAEAFQQEMRDREADWVFCNYGKAPHAFTNPAADTYTKPEGLGYNHEANIRSWAATVALLKEKLMTENGGTL